MRYLVLKDYFLLQKSRLVLVFACVTVLGFLFRSMTEGQIIIAMSMAGLILIMFSTTWEGKSDVLWNSLPVPKWQIVGAKYLSIFAYLVVTLVLIFLSSAVGTLVGSSVTVAAKFPSIFFGALVFIILSCLYWPLFFALGYVASRYAASAFYIGLVLVTPYLNRGYQAIQLWLNALAGGVSAALALTLSMVVVGFLVAISFGISLCFYRRRQF